VRQNVGGAVDGMHDSAAEHHPDLVHFELE